MRIREVRDALIAVRLQKVSEVRTKDRRPELLAELELRFQTVTTEYFTLGGDATMWVAMRSSVIKMDESALRGEAAVIARIKRQAATTHEIQKAVNYRFLVKSHCNQTQAYGLELTDQEHVNVLLCQIDNRDHTEELVSELRGLIAAWKDENCG